MPRPSPAPPLRRSLTSARVIAVREGSAVDRPDRLATEEPLEIRAGGPGQEAVSVAVTMRTPGNDFELAVGFLYTEGLVGSPREVTSLSYCQLPPDEQHYNVVTVRLARPFDPGFIRRNFFATSSCGVCGKASLDQVEIACAPVGPGPVVAGSVLLGLPQTLRQAQRVFEETGGLHAAGLFDSEGALLTLREDVGRHNAVDKLVGRAFLDGDLPLISRVMLASGRVSFEIVQKAALAGVPVVCAVSAPSSLAVEAGARLGVTVIGFLRQRGFNVYSHPDRIDMES